MVGLCFYRCSLFHDVRNGRIFGRLWCRVFCCRCCESCGCVATGGLIERRWLFDLFQRSRFVFRCHAERIDRIVLRIVARCRVSVAVCRDGVVICRRLFNFVAGCRLTVDFGRRHGCVLVRQDLVFLRRLFRPGRRNHGGTIDLVSEAGDREGDVFGLAVHLGIVFRVERGTVIEWVFDTVFGHLDHFDWFVDRWIDHLFSRGLHSVQSGQHGADGFFRAARMAFGFAVQFFDELRIGAALCVDLISKFGRAAGLYFAALGICQQHRVGVGCQRDPISFGVVGDVPIFAFLPRHFLPARHVAELVDQPFGRWV